MRIQLPPVYVADIAGLTAALGQAWGREEGAYALLDEIGKRIEVLSCIPTLLEPGAGFALLHERTQAALKQLRELKNQALTRLHEQVQTVERLKGDIAKRVREVPGVADIEAGGILEMDSGERILVFTVEVLPAFKGLPARLSVEGLSQRDGRRDDVKVNLYSEIRDHESRCADAPADCPSQSELAEHA
jgi:hypothetical protein